MNLREGLNESPRLSGRYPVSQGHRSDMKRMKPALAAWTDWFSGTGNREIAGPPDVDTDGRSFGQRSSNSRYRRRQCQDDDRSHA